MKLKLLLGLVLVLFIFGCNQTIERPDIQANIQEEPTAVYAQCKLDYFVIEPVDELLPSNCYAFRNNADMDSYGYGNYILNKSLQYAGKDAFEIMQETRPNDICGHITPENFGNDVYCLRDGSSCLIVEDNKICSIINLT